MALSVPFACASFVTRTTAHYELRHGASDPPLAVLDCSRRATGSLVLASGF